jgi:hypothetical protein
MAPSLRFARRIELIACRIWKAWERMVNCDTEPLLLTFQEAQTLYLLLRDGYVDDEEKALFEKVDAYIKKEVNDANPH